MVAVILFSLFLSQGVPPPDAQKQWLDTFRDALDAARQWAHLLDSERFNEAWQQTTDFFRSKIDRDTWNEAAQEIHRDHIEHRPSNRRLVVSSRGSAESPAGLPRGGFWAILVKTQFLNGSSLLETFIVQRDGDRWQIAGYYRDRR